MHFLTVDIIFVRDHRSERVQGLQTKPRLEPTRWVVLAAVPLERTKVLRLQLDPRGARCHRTPDPIVSPKMEERLTLQLRFNERYLNFN